MSRKGTKWYRTELGQPESVDIDPASVRKAHEAGCDITCTRSFAHVARYGTAYLRKLLRDPRSFFHAVPMYDTDGRIVDWATRTNSGEDGGNRARAAARLAHGVPPADSQPVLLPIRR